MKIDVTCLTWLSCARRFQFRLFKELKNGPGEDYSYLNFGNMFHKYAELWALGKAPTDILAHVNEYADNPKEKADWAIKAVGFDAALRQANFGKFWLDEHGVPGIEYRFAYEIIGTDYLLCGTVDRVEEPDEFRLFVRDLKTAWKPPYHDYQYKYINNLQLRLYEYVINRTTNLRVSGCYTFFHVGLPIIGVFHSDKIILTPEDVDMIEWFIPAACKKIDKIRSIHENGELALPEGRAYNICDNCPYRTICNAEQSIREEMIRTWPREPYDPLTHGQKTKST